MPEYDARPRGILTQADREFLAGERDVTDQTARNTRCRIRNRVYHALLDFQVLWCFLDDEDLEQIFAPDSDQRKDGIRSSVQDMIALTILGLWENDDYYPPRLHQAIEQAAFARNRRVDVSLEVEESLMDSPDTILRKLLDSGFAHTSYEEFEKALTDPDADPELLRTVLDSATEDDITIDEIEQMQEAYEEAPLVRTPYPKVLNVQVAFDD